MPYVQDMSYVQDWLLTLHGEQKVSLCSSILKANPLQQKCFINILIQLSQAYKYTNKVIT